MVMKEGKIKADRATWLSGFGLVALLAVMATGLWGPRMGDGGAVRTRNDAHGIERAVLLFEDWNGRLPEVGSSAFDSDGEEGRLFLAILLGKEADGIQAQNLNRVPLLSLRTTMSAARGGLLLGKKQEIVGLYDGWGEPFEILLRKPGERGITLVHRGKTVMIEQPAVVLSKGEDRIAGTKDDVRTSE